MQLLAIDNNDIRVHIDETHSNAEYFCPFCGAPLICKKGEIRRHHFAHKKNHICTDSWARMHYYDDSDWHIDWQNCFPKDNQEIKLSLGKTVHRADVFYSISLYMYNGYYNCFCGKGESEKVTVNYYNCNNELVYTTSLPDED